MIRPLLHRSRARLAALAALVGVVTAAGALTPVDAAPDAARTRAVAADAADPAVVIDGATTYVFTTNTTTDRGTANVPVRRWRAGEGWTTLGDALPALPSWTRPGTVWAPGVARLPSGTWLLAYTTRHVATGRQCIGLATAAAAAGPYRSTRDQPTVCEVGEGGSIDAAPFVDTDGSMWLTWKTDANAIGRRTELRSARLDDSLRLSGPVHRLLRASLAWERGVIENPALVRSAAGLHLLYSGGRWEDGSYATGVARCASPAGPCRRTSRAPALATAGSLIGPGGASVATDAAGTTQLVFHAWEDGVGYERGAYRALHSLPIDLHTGTIRTRADRRPLGRPDDRRLFVLRSAPTAAPVDTALRFGGPGGQVLACDFDGNGVDAPTWFRHGRWHRAELASSNPASTFDFGTAGHVARCADFDGDGADEAVVWHGGLFTLRDAGTHATHIRLAGGDQPLVGDWDGDGDADPGVRDAASGRFVLRHDRGHEETFTLGPAGGRAVVGDWDGDGADDVGVFVDATFHLYLPLGPDGVRRAAFVVPMGDGDDHPIAGRWSAEAVADSVGVVR